MPDGFLLNTLAERGAHLIPADEECLGTPACNFADRLLARLEAHRSTPLVALPALAGEIGLASLHVKDESGRHGLGSFKALGGGHAVLRLVLEAAGRQLGGPVSDDALFDPAVRAVARKMTVACASDGNHGRAVAAAAAAVGAGAVIFLHERVSRERAAAITRLGAEIVQVPGTYDDSVVEAARRAAARGWTLVSDTSWPGYDRIPRLVMQGYTVMANEALAALPAAPTHVFAQAGVGGLAAAVAGHLALALGRARPAVLVVEPARAACLFESARAGRPVKIAPGEPTVMAMLECYQPSLVAWGVLARTADAFMTVDERDAVGAMRVLARPRPGDPAIVAGESGGVGLAGLLRLAGDDRARAAVGLDARARVLLFNTEGATDQARYASLVGSRRETAKPPR